MRDGGNHDASEGVGHYFAEGGFREARP
jgi:hypothetical protein